MKDDGNLKSLVSAYWDAKCRESWVKKELEEVRTSLLERLEPGDRFRVGEVALEVRAGSERVTVPVANAREHLTEQDFERVKNVTKPAPSVRIRRNGWTPGEWNERNEGVQNG